MWNDDMTYLSLSPRCTIIYDGGGAGRPTETIDFVIYARVNNSVSYLTTQVEEIAHTIADIQHMITDIKINTTPLPHVPAACLKYNLSGSSYEPDDDCCAVFGSCAEGYEFTMGNPCAVIAVESDTHTAYKTVCVAT